jgi:hypothetical protein
MMLKPAPDIAAALTVTADVPLDVSVNVCVAAEFTAVFPKLSVVTFIVNRGFTAVPVPLNATTVVLPDAESLVIVICPVAEPVAIGLNCTWSVSDWPGLNVTGKLPPPMMLKLAPDIATALTVTADVPLDVSVNVCVAAEFTVVFPKLSDAVLTVS